MASGRERLSPLPQLAGPACDACHGPRSNSGHSDGWNAYLRRARGESVVIAHPGHPLSGRVVAVLHYRPKGGSPTVLVELPDGTAQCIPVSWTDRATPNPHEAASAAGARLSGLALLELVEYLESWEEKR